MPKKTDKKPVDPNMERFLLDPASVKIIKKGKKVDETCKDGVCPVD
jgi:hypothetical protein